MDHQCHTRSIFLTLILLALLSACTNIQFPETPAWKEVPITEMSQVTGAWKGVTWTEPRTRRQDDWVNLTIHREGAFEFSSYRTIGAWARSGTLQLKNGALTTVSTPDMGSATFTLHETSGQRMLKVKGTTADGQPQRAELEPVQ